jgi:hypothetical protein
MSDADQASASVAVEVANPPGIPSLTQEQRNELERMGYWEQAIRYGLDYYVSGRFATAHHFNPVSANILHHGVEMMLKACLARNDTLEEIRKYGAKGSYGHDIEELWRAFRNRQDTPPADEFDAIIRGLHAFEDIRYPERLVRDGATISIGIFETDGPGIRRLDGRPLRPTYELQLPRIDRLMRLLFEASGANPDAFLPRVTNDERAMIFYNTVRPKLFGRSTETARAAPVVSKPELGMRELPRTLTAIGAVLSLIGALCVGYAVFNRFDGREYHDVGFGGVVARTPEYVAWANRNDHWSYLGLAFVTISSALQLVALCLPSSTRGDEQAESP